MNQIDFANILICYDLRNALKRMTNPIFLVATHFSNNHLLIAGVQLWKLEERPNVGSMLLRLNFSTDVAPRLLFLKDIGVEDSRLGYIISHNPFILTESLENLHAR